jgi:hypothetical protein
LPKIAENRRKSPKIVIITASIDPQEWIDLQANPNQNKIRIGAIYFSTDGQLNTHNNNAYYVGYK